MARASETVQVKIKIGKWVYQQLQIEVAGRGLSVADEIAQIVQVYYEQRARSLALENIESTVKAADFTVDAVEQLLTTLRLFEPLDMSPISASGCQDGVDQDVL
jgi:hypothetical protein